MKKDTTYILKKIEKDYTSNQGKFVWPKKIGSILEAEDWDPKPECGGGIHGLEWGCGSFNIMGYGELFVVLEVDKKDGFINLMDKVKVKKGKIVVISKTAKPAIDFLKSKNPNKTTIYNLDE